MLLPKVGLVLTRMVGPKMASETLLGRSRITWCNICRGIMLLLVQMVTMAKTDFRFSESEPDSQMQEMPAKVARTSRFNQGTTRLNSSNQRIRHNNKLTSKITKRLPIRTNRINHPMCEYLS